MHREQGAVLGRGGEHVGQPRQLLGEQLAVVVAGHARVERDDPQAVDLVHPVLEAVVVGVEEAAREGGPLVVVAHRPDDDRPHRRSRRLHDRAQRLVGIGRGLVGQVAGEDEGLRRRSYGGEPIDGAAEVLGVVHHAVV